MKNAKTRRSDVEMLEYHRTEAARFAERVKLRSSEQVRKMLADVRAYRRDATKYGSVNEEAAAHLEFAADALEVTARELAGAATAPTMFDDKTTAETDEARSDER